MKRVIGISSVLVMIACGNGTGGSSGGGSGGAGGSNVGGNGAVDSGSGGSGGSGSGGVVDLGGVMIDGGGNGGSCTVAKGFCATLTVPASYNATATNLVVGLYKTLGPTGPMGPPDVVAMQMKTPSISPSQPLAIMPSALTVSGDYFVYVALYVKGGGTFQPVKGIDYVTQTTQTITVGGATSPEVGTLALMLAQ